MMVESKKEWCVRKEERRERRGNPEAMTMGCFSVAPAQTRTKFQIGITGSRDRLPMSHRHIRPLYLPHHRGCEALDHSKITEMLLLYATFIYPYVFTSAAQSPFYVEPYDWH